MISVEPWRNHRLVLAALVLLAALATRPVSAQWADNGKRLVLCAYCQWAPTVDTSSTIIADPPIDSHLQPLLLDGVLGGSSVSWHNVNPASQWRGPAVDAISRSDASVVVTLRMSMQDSRSATQAFQRTVRTVAVDVPEASMRGDVIPANMFVLLSRGDAAGFVAGTFAAATTRSLSVGCVSWAPSWRGASLECMGFANAVQASCSTCSVHTPYVGGSQQVAANTVAAAAWIVRNHGVDVVYAPADALTPAVAAHLHGLGVTVVDGGWDGASRLTSSATAHCAVSPVDTLRALLPTLATRSDGGSVVRDTEFQLPSGGTLSFATCTGGACPATPSEVTTVVSGYRSGSLATRINTAAGTPVMEPGQFNYTAVRNNIAPSDAATPPARARTVGPLAVGSGQYAVLGAHLRDTTLLNVDAFTASTVTLTRNSVVVPDSLTGYAMAAVGNGIVLIYGGNDGTNFATQHFLKIDFNTVYDGTVTSLDTVPTASDGPQALWGAAGTTVEGSGVAYFHGGTTAYQSVQRQLYSFDYNARKWIGLKNAAYPRHSHAIAASTVHDASGELYVAGGSRTGYVLELEKYSVSRNTWASMPLTMRANVVSRVFPCLAIWNTHIYIGGGEDFHGPRADAWMIERADLFSGGDQRNAVATFTQVSDVPVSGAVDCVLHQASGALNSSRPTLAFGETATPGLFGQPTHPPGNVFDNVDALNRLLLVPQNLTSIRQAAVHVQPRYHCESSSVGLAATIDEAKCITTATPTPGAPPTPAITIEPSCYYNCGHTDGGDGNAEGLYIGIPTSIGCVLLGAATGVLVYRKVSGRNAAGNPDSAAQPAQPISAVPVIISGHGGDDGGAEGVIEVHHDAPPPHPGAES